MGTTSQKIVAGLPLKNRQGIVGAANVSSPVLLNPDDPWFPHVHAMSHRDYLGVMSPLTRFSAIPYFIEPFTAKRGSDNWHFNHQTAHDDADNAIPSTYMGPPAVVGFSPNMKDANLANA